MFGKLGLLLERSFCQSSHHVWSTRTRPGKRKSTSQGSEAGDGALPRPTTFWSQGVSEDHTKYLPEPNLARLHSATLLPTVPLALHGLSTGMTWKHTKSSRTLSDDTFARNTYWKALNPPRLLRRQTVGTGMAERRITKYLPPLAPPSLKPGDHKRSFALAGIGPCYQEPQIWLQLWRVMEILRGTASTATVKSGAIFQARINLLSMHAMMLYSETMRYVELSDLCILRLEHEHCLIVFQKITHSKTIRSAILSTRDFRISLGRHSNHMG